MTIVCKVCGKPGVTYGKPGKQRTRPYCVEHWNAYIRDNRIERLRKQGVPEGWKGAPNHWQTPPPGVTRIVCDGYRFHVTVYRDNALRTTPLVKLRTTAKMRLLVGYFLAKGFRVTVQRPRWWVLEFGQDLTKRVG